MIRRPRELDPEEAPAAPPGWDPPGDPATLDPTTGTLAEDDVEPPSIAPPVLLEPVPVPRLLTPPTDPGPADHDPYALAAAAASAMEREGRAFDASSTTPPDLQPDDVTEDAHVARPPPATSPDPPAPAPHRAPARRPRGRSVGLPIALGVVALALIAGVVAGLWLTSDTPTDSVLRPVPADVAPVGARGTADDDAIPAGAGRLRITSDPPGALVRVDGEALGPTPLSVDLPFGAYQAEIELDGHAPARRVLQLSSSQRLQEIEARLVPEVPLARVRLVAPGWEGAALRINGEDRGVVPTTVDLPAGVYLLELTLGDRTRRVERTVWVNRQRLVEVDLAAD